MICNHTVILVVNVWQPGKPWNWIWTHARYGASCYNWVLL